MLLRYSSSVVAPMHWRSPLDKAGLSILAASMEPVALPAPTIVWISSMKRMMFLLLCNSLRIAFMRSSNCPLYLVPATIEARSSEITRLSNSTLETFRCTIRRARPSTMADFPTPGSPISTGLFFLRRLRICARRMISSSRPTTGSRRPSKAALVMSLPKLSRAGVSVPVVCLVRVCCLGSPAELSLPRGRSSSSSGSSSVKPAPARGPG